MGCTVFELERKLSARELAEWRVFYEIEPFGPQRDNYHAAQIASMVGNVARPKKTSPKFTLAQFFFKDSRTAREEKDRAMVNWLDRRS